MLQTEKARARTYTRKTIQILTAHVKNGGVFELRICMCAMCINVQRQNFQPQRKFKVKELVAHNEIASEWLNQNKVKVTKTQTKSMYRQNE